jgi:acylphosphatase
MPSRTSQPSFEDLHLSVHGQVQGVGFRECIVQVALELDLEGWVRNRSDGTVEAVVRGAPQACDRLVQWSRRGPVAARVDRVLTRPASAEESAQIDSGFRRLASR